MEYQNQRWTDFEEIVQRTVNTEVKARLKSNAIVQDLDVYCPKGHCLSHNTSLKVQTQGFRDSFCSKKTKSKDLKFAMPRCNMAKPAKKKNKNKRPVRAERTNSGHWRQCHQGHKEKKAQSQML